MAAFALLALPAGASASAKSATTTFSGHGTIGTVTPKCKSGERATGGGWLTTPARIAPNLLITHVFESQKVGQRSWRVSAQVHDGALPSDVVSLTGYVYCSKDAPKTTAKSKSATTAVQGLVSATASCGSKRVQSGGFSTTPPIPGPGGFHSVVFGSLRTSKSSWGTTAAAYAPPPSITAISYAYCAESPKPTKTDVGSATVSGSDVVVVPSSGKCKSGKQPIAGGFDQQPASAINDRFHVWESRKSGKRWRFSATHGGGPAKTLSAVAYCV